MNAIQLIEDNLDVESILEHYDFDNIKAHGNYIRSCCKLHGGSNPTAFVINYDTGLWSCHTGSCGNGNIFHLVQKLEGIEFPYAVHKVAEILKLDINNLEIVAKNAQERKELRKFLKTLQKHQSQELVEFIPTNGHKKITKFKAFDLSTIEYFGARYFDEFDSVSSNGQPITIRSVVAFPITKQGITVGYSLRSTRPDAYIKWSHQPAHINTSELLYNYDNVIGQPEVVVVEGITDVWAYHEIGVPAVATYGAHITDAQKAMLLQLGCDLVFSFDGDKAGRFAMNKAYQLFSKTSNIKFVHLSEGTDPESIPREELRSKYDTRTIKSVS